MWPRAARRVLGPVLVAGREGAGSGVGREGLLVALTAQGPCGTEQDPVLLRRDQCPDPSEHRAPGWAQPWEQERPPGLQPGLQEVAGSRAELIPVALTPVRASRE